MSPYPVEPARASGPMRLVLSAYPSRAAAFAAVEGALARKLIACASVVRVDSRYLWRGRVERAAEALVLFKTVPKRAGALFLYLRETHPYEVPEVAEIDVPRVDPGYVAYLLSTLDPSALPPVHVRRALRSVTRRVGRRAPAARAPARTRGRHPRRSR